VRERRDSIVGADKAHRPADGSIECPLDASAEVRQNRLQLPSAQLDWVQVEGAKRQEQQGGSGRLAAGVRHLACPHVVEDHDVAEPQLPSQRSFDERLRDFGVGRPLNGHHRAHALEVKPPHHRDDGARAAWHVPQCSIATGCARVVTRHRDVAAGPVQEHEPMRVERLGDLDEPAAQFLDARTCLLRCAQELLGDLVWSGFSLTISLTGSHSSGAARLGFAFLWGSGSRLPVSRCGRFHRGGPWPRQLRRVPQPRGPSCSQGAHHPLTQIHRVRPRHSPSWVHQIRTAGSGYRQALSIETMMRRGYG